MAKKTLPKLSPKLEEELHIKLEELLDTYDEVKDKKRRLSKLLGGHLKVVGGSIDLARRQLKGIDLDQLEFAETGVPSPAQDPLVADILRLAGGIVAREEAEEEAELEWREEDDDGVFHRSMVDDVGYYDILPTQKGTWRAEWVPRQGASKTVGEFNAAEAAKEACKRHRLEAIADATLKNAGSGDLTKKDLKGPAEKFKKGGGRG